MQLARADTTLPRLVAHWTFDSVSANANADDSIGTNTAIPGGQDGSDPQPSTDVPPVSFPDTESMQFDGSDYFTIDNPVTTDFTICAWIKTTSAGGGTQHWTSAPIMDAEVGGVAYDFGFGVGNGGKLMFGNGGVALGNDPGTQAADLDAQVNGATIINDDAWHDACVTRDGSTGQDILYVDASVDGTGTTGIGTQTANAHARIGWGYDGAALYDGLIDDIRVYNGVLTQGELANLATGSSDPSLAPGDDGDGVTKTVEDAAPNGGDANNDGTADSAEANVASFVDTSTSHYVSVATDNSCTLSSAQSQAPGALTDDANYSYPTGLVSFDAACASSQVKLYFYDPPDGNFVLRKYLNGSYQTVPGATISRATIAGQPVVIATYTVTDGGSLDADGTANGVIVDPVGLAIANGPAAALTNTGINLAATGILAGSLIAAAAGVYFAVKRKPQGS
jgi:hypothetical protein